MPFEITSAEKAMVIRARGIFNRGNVLDLYSYVASNVISLNSLNALAIEIRGGLLELQALDEGFISVAGYGDVLVNGELCENWTTIPVRPQDNITIRSKNDSVVYVNIIGGIPSGLEGVELRHGTKLSEARSYDSEEICRILSALRVPETIRPTTQKVICVATPKMRKQYGNTVKAVLFKKREYYLLKMERPPPSDETIVDAEPPVLRSDGGILIPILHYEHDDNVCGWIPSDDLDSLARLESLHLVDVKYCSESYAMEKCSEYMEKLLWLKRTIETSIEAVKRGAKAFRVKVNGRTYIAWIESL